MLISVNHRARVMVVLVVTLAMIGGVYAYAYASGQAARSTTLKACYPKKGGDLRITTHACKSSEKSVKLNPKGQRGPQGAKGSPGAPGQPGPTGPSHAYTFHQELITNSVEITTANQKTVATIQLPAGFYAFSGAARILFRSAATTADCQLIVDGDQVEEDNVDLSSAADDAVLPFTQVAQMHEDGDATLGCSTTTGGNYDVDEIQLTAVKVGAMTNENP